MKSTLKVFFLNSNKWLWVSQSKNIISKLNIKGFNSKRDWGGRLF